MNENEFIDNGLIGLRIKEIRTRNKITQETIAEKLKIQQSDVSEIENGKRKLIDMTLLNGLADVLQVPLSYILTGEHVEGLKKCNDYYEAVISVQNAGMNLKNLAEEWRDDARVVCIAVHNDGDAIQYASSRLRANRQIIEIALRQKPTALEFVPDSFKDDKELVKTTIMREVAAFPFASTNLQNDVELFEIFLNSGGGYLLFDLDSSIRKNKSIGLLMVDRNPELIDFIDDDLRRDIDIIAAGAAKLNLSTSDRDDPNTMMNLIEEKGEYALLYCSDSLYENRDFVLDMIKNTKGDVWRNVSSNLKSDRDFCISAINLAPSVLDIDEELREEFHEIGANVVGLGGEASNNPDSFLRSVEKYGYLSLYFMGDEISKNESLMIRACMIDSLSVLFVKPDILNRKSFWKKLMAEGESISSSEYSDNIPSELRDDESFMLDLIKIDERMFLYASDRLHRDNIFLLNALKTNYKIKRYIYVSCLGENDEDKELLNLLNEHSDEEISDN